VKMSDDTLLVPYELQPGQNITLVSRYDASVDHYGAAPAACYFLQSGKLRASTCCLLLCRCDGAVCAVPHRLGPALPWQPHGSCGSQHDSGHHL
jgi:hypothetical protein